MRSAFLCLAAAGILSVLSPASHAASRGFAIDIDPAAPTLGELLDREAREAAARREATRKQAAPPAAPPRSDVTGSVSGPRISATPYIPRGAVTVILPHPRANAGRPIGHHPARR